MGRPSSPPSPPPGDNPDKDTEQVVGKVARRAAEKSGRREVERRGTGKGRVSGLDLLRGLVTENLVLRREVAELRLLTVGSCHDPMTGLGNRRFLRQRLAEELSRSQRRTEHGGVLVLVRIADLRTLARGADRRVCLEAIQSLAQSFRALLRVADICCRVSFGSFGCLLPDTDPAGAARVIRRMKIAAMRVSAHTSVPVSVSFGSASWPEVGLTAARIWARAERSLLREEQGRARPSVVASSRPVSDSRPVAANGLKVIRGGLASG